MKRISWLIVVIGILLTNCSNQDVLPSTTWSEGCVELAPNGDGYRLNGICCAYLTLPMIKLNKNRRFSLKGDYYIFTGAGFASTPVKVTGALSADGGELVLTYSFGAGETKHSLKPGPANTFCYCGCL
jgi:hypothetical protein